jgi:hypothetical protein
MTPSEDLFELIRSLSMSEKRHFNIYTSKHVIGRQNEYILLFKAIESQNEYDENELKKRFAGTSLLKRFAVAKNYLYTLILKSLRIFYSGYNAELEVKELMEYSVILFELGLYSQCHKILKRAREIAIKCEMHIQLLEISNRQIDIMKEQRDFKQLGDFLKKNREEEKKEFEIILNQQKYNELSSNIYYLQDKIPYIRNEKDLKIFDPYTKTDLFKNENKALSFTAKIFFFLSQSNFYFSSGNFKKSYYYRKKHVELWESYPELANDQPLKYANALFNLSMGERGMKKYKEALKTIEKLEQVRFKSRFDERTTYMNVSGIKLSILGDTGKYKEGILFLNEVETKIKSFKKHVNPRWLLNHYLRGAFFYFRAEDHKNALLWINKLLNHEQITLFDQIHSFGRIMNLLIHYELGNQELLENAIKSTHHFLKKRKKLHRFEFLILDFIKNIHKVNSRKDLTDALNILREKVIALSEDPEEMRIINYFKFLSWIDGKANKRSNEIERIRTFKAYPHKATK